MIFEKCKLDGVLIITPELIEDNRGFFARSFCSKEFEEHGVVFDVKQCNYSYNMERGTLRGMHYQNAPFSEKKIVTCLKGRVYDVVVDLRIGSNTYLKWEGFELSENNLKSVYIPEGFAHGYVTLEDGSFLFYEMSAYYVKGQENGVRYNDPKIGIVWPDIGEIIVSEKDKSFELL